MRRRPFLHQLVKLLSQRVEKLRSTLARAPAPFGFDVAAQPEHGRLDRKGEGSPLARPQLGIRSRQGFIQRLFRRELAGSDLQQQIWSQAREAIDTLHRRADTPSCAPTTSADSL